MKNKLEMEQHSEVRAACDESKASRRRDSPAPRIVVCPPEGTSEPSAARGGRLLRALARRVRRRDDDDAGSSDSGSSGGSDSSESSGRRRPRSAVSLRRVFESLSISARSLSTSPPERARAPKKNPQPQRILRPPVTYTYVRGLSGLPTQRVPRARPSGLNR